MGVAVGLDSLLDSLSRCLDLESSQRLVQFRVDESLQERIDTLSERGNEGLLNSEERSEYEAFVNAADIISILKLKARERLEHDLR